MGEDSGSRLPGRDDLGDGDPEAAVDVLEPPETDAEEAAEGPTSPPTTKSNGRRRFTIAAVVAIVLTAVPYLWILWGSWESPNFLRQTIYQDDFYDLQARAIFHGHLWIPNGSIGIEAFVYGHRQYTYFGLFPSIIRMPILLFTHSLDGRLTAPFMLLAWLLTGLLASMLVWRIRILVRGSVAMGAFETVASGLLMATIMGGTVLTLLGATPFVFNEDIAWSICLVTGSLFAMLGVLERPSWGRVWASGLFLLAANLDRATTAWAASAGAVLIAIRFWLGRGGKADRRWALPMLGAGMIPLLVGFGVNYLKFGGPIGVSNLDQVFTQVNAYRRKFLASNHNAEYGSKFIPSTLLAYLRPNGLRLTSIFPFITLPSAPAHSVAGILFDRRYRTASITASTPLLFLLSLWGVVTAFRPHPVGRIALTRILLVVSAGAVTPLLIWGYIAPRYLGDFVPFLALGSAVAMVDICRRLEARRWLAHFGALVVIVVLALFSIAANIGISITPNEEWNTTQVYHYVEAQKLVSDVTGHRLNAHVIRGNSLPGWAPADELYVIGDCDGLYISNGEDYSTVPAQQYQRTTWMTVQLGHLFQHTFDVTANASAAPGTTTFPLVMAGSDTVMMSATPSQDGSSETVTYELKSPSGIAKGLTHTVRSGTTIPVVVTTDPVKHTAEVYVHGVAQLLIQLNVGTPIVAYAGRAQSGLQVPALSVVNVTATSPGPSLCKSLIRPTA